jgi:hypothetical protein
MWSVAGGVVLALDPVKDRLVGGGPGGPGTSVEQFGDGETLRVSRRYRLAARTRLPSVPPASATGRAP